MLSATWGYCWEDLPPSRDIEYDETLVTYKNDEHAEIALSANLYKLYKITPDGLYQFSIPVLVAANSRRNMGYTASYGTSDIPNIHDAQTLHLGDNEGDWVDIGFSILFYGAWYTRVFITSNGLVTFDNRSYNDNGGKWTSPNPASIPTTDDPNIILAPFWRDLDPSKGGTIEHGYLESGEFAVVWRDVPNKANSNTQTFALCFGYGPPPGIETSVISFVYGSITNDVSTSIGIEDQTGKHGETVASMSSGEKVEFTDSPGNDYWITQIKVSMSKLNASGVNDEEAIIYIQGWDESRPGGINVILEDPAEGKYDVPPIVSVASFAVGTVGLLMGWGWVSFAGYLADGAILAYELSPMPRGTTVHEAMEPTKTAYVQAMATDENFPEPYDSGHSHDVSISPLILWQILDPTDYHSLVIKAEVTIQRPDWTTYTLTTSTPLKVNLGVTLHLVIDYEDLSAHHEIAYAVKDELAKIGIKVVIDMRDETTIENTVWGGYWYATWDEVPNYGWDIAWYEYPHEIKKGKKDPLEYHYYASATPPEGYNIMCWNYDETDYFLGEAMDSTDATERKRFLGLWQEKFMHHPPCVIIYYPKDVECARGIAFNLHHPVLSNRYVRQAVAHAIPYDYIGEVLQDFHVETYPGKPPKAPIRPDTYYDGVCMFNEELPAYTYDIAKAQQYMNMWYYSRVDTNHTKGPVGDADFSGFVEPADFPIWADNLGTTPEDWVFLPGNDIDPDHDNNALVEMSDYYRWQESIGNYYPFPGAR